LPRDLPEYYAITAALRAGEKWVPSKAVGDSFGAGNIEAFPNNVDSSRLSTPTPFLKQAACRDWLNRFKRLLDSGIELVQLRVKELPAAQLEELARYCQGLAGGQGIRLMLNGPAELARDLGMAGVHLTSEGLMASHGRPLSEEYLIGASCHSPEELKKAEAIGADFACLSPIRAVKGYARGESLGFDRFGKWVADCDIPVYALGGLRREDLDAVRTAGGQGVAGISAFWN
jgi:thiamine-phosphate diphosphorylase